jgi:hypothetical protein
MDANKYKKLKEIGYIIQPSCLNCQHGIFSSTDWWGTCSIHQYEHLKHSTSLRDLSIHKTGCCSKHEWKELSITTLGKFEEFKQRKEVKLCNT